MLYVRYNFATFAYQKMNHAATVYQKKNRVEVVEHALILQFCPESLKSFKADTLSKQMLVVQKITLINLLQNTVIFYLPIVFKLSKLPENLCCTFI